MRSALVELDPDEVLKLRARKSFTRSPYGVPVNQVLSYLHDEALAGPSASTSTSNGSTATEWEKAGNRFLRYKRTISEEILNTQFKMEQHPTRTHMMAWYARTLDAVDILVSKCNSGEVL
jgi:hypothetical protein